MNERSSKLDSAKLAKMATEVECCQVAKLLEVASIISGESKLNEKLCREEIFHIAALSVADTHYGQGMGIEMVKKSLEVARENKFEYAKMNCTSDNTRKIAEELNFTKHWSAPFKDILCRGNIQPRSLPEPPHCNASVYFFDLKTLKPKC